MKSRSNSFLLHRETLFAGKGRARMNEYGLERLAEMLVGDDGCARYSA